MSTTVEYDEKREKKEFWNGLYGQIEFWGNENLRTNERKVLEAIKILFKNSDDIEIFNKKAI